jgi:hypothetical protein
MTLGIGGHLDGAGKFAISGGPYVETEWTAPRSGEHIVTATYRARATGSQEVFNDNATNVATPLNTNIAVMNADSDELAAKTFLDHGVDGPDIDEELLEEVLSFFAGRLLAPYLGPIGRIVAGFVLDYVIDWIIPNDRPEAVAIDRTYTRQLRFWPEKGRTYRLRFSTIGGFSGTSHQRSGGFRATVSRETILQEFSVRPTGIGTTHTLSVTKRGTRNGLGVYAVTVDGALERGKGSESEVEGTTALDWVGPKRGTDQLRYSGDIDRFLLKGDAVAYQDGDRIDPESHPSQGENGANLPNTLTVTKGSTKRGLGAYTVTVDGELEPTESSEAFVSGPSALDWVGSKRGTDRLRFSGKITDFVLKGDARVSVNGNRVNPDAL